MSNSLPSNLAINEVAYFQPDLRKIKIGRDKKTNKVRYLFDDTAIAVKVVGVYFTESKVYYDLIVPNGEGSFYSASPLRCVDSIMVQNSESRDPLRDNESEEPGWWHEI